MYNLRFCFLVLAILLPKLVPADEKFKNLLYRFGYMQQKMGKDKDSVPTEKEFVKAVMKFQKFNGLGVTGVLDKETTEKMASPRCGVPDFEPGESRGIRKWFKNDLTWFIEKFSKTPIKETEQIEAMKNGLARWAKVSKLNFKESKSGTDLKIEFGRDEHGDGFPFDAEDGVLAHAFYPESGKVHFDDAEDWQSDKVLGKNLEVVAAHEFGHSLGLSHSDVPDSMMAPYYQGYMEGLHQDDIIRIQGIYGAKEATTTTTTTTTPPPTTTAKPTTTTTTTPPPTTTTAEPTTTTTTTPSPTTTAEPTTTLPVSTSEFCGHTFATVNAAMKVGSQGSTYLFVDEFYVIDGSTGRREKTMKIFPNAPQTVTAAVFSEDLQKALLFSDNKVWSYSLSGGKFYTNSGYPKSHRDTEFDKPDAAMIIRDYEHVERVFVFKNDKLREWITYYEDLPRETTLTSAYFFIGIPKHIDAILSVKTQIIFISGQNSYTMNSDFQIVQPSDENIKSLLGPCKTISQ